MKQRRNNQLGYTAVEVLVSMTLFAIGAAGVVGMQRVSIQGNADARRADVATGIATEWLARLRRDSMSWTQPNSVVTTDNRNTNTLWLRDTEVTLKASPLPPNTGWKVPLVPAAGNIGAAYTFDVLGREVAPGAVDRFFCVNYRLDWLSGWDGATGNTLRAEVRVFWPRLEEKPTATCAPALAEGPGQPVFHFVYATTTLRRNAT